MQLILELLKTNKFALHSLNGDDTSIKKLVEAENFADLNLIGHVAFYFIINILSIKWLHTTDTSYNKLLRTANSLPLPFCYLYLFAETTISGPTNNFWHRILYLLTKACCQIIWFCIFAPCTSIFISWLSIFKYITKCVVTVCATAFIHKYNKQWFHMVIYV